MSKKIIQLSLLFTFALTACAHQPPSPIQALTATTDAIPVLKLAPRAQVEAHGKKWMISTQGIASTQAAAEVIHAGGNLIDAAIAASFAVSVERPQSTGLGGGGFLIYHEAKTGKNFVLDFRERAPARASKNMYLNAKGEVIENLSINGGLAIGVPGLVRGLKLAHQKWGNKKTSWPSLLQPAIRLAQNGFKIYKPLASALNEEADDLNKFPASKKIFLNADGRPKKEGDLLVQVDLAKTLGVIAKNPESIYTGAIARQIVKAVQAQKGILSLADLRNYQVKERPAVVADFRGYQIVSMPPPSSGGIHVIQILKLLEKDELNAQNFLSAQSLHLEAEAMQQAFADRAKYLGDPDFVSVPTDALIQDAYLAKLRSEFDEKNARPSSQVFAGKIPPPEPEHTTHLTLMDSEGNVVVSTQTINGYFGSGLVAAGTGIVLNNEMDDFAAKQGVQNIFGATAISDANSIAPHKTPLSSMSPTIVLKDGMPVLALGAPGGTRIITAVAQTILNYLVFHQDLYTSIAAPRIHHQWRPDTLLIENQPVAVEVLQDLNRRGYHLERVRAEANVMAVAREGDDLVGVADPRDIGTSYGE
jgi:gamma-glutamyltranspeptidase/glutathione hydrolase